MAGRNFGSSVRPDIHPYTTRHKAVLTASRATTKASAIHGVCVPEASVSTKAHSGFLECQVYSPIHLKLFVEEEQTPPEPPEMGKMNPTQDPGMELQRVVGLLDSQRLTQHFGFEFGLGEVLGRPFNGLKLGRFLVE